MNGDIAGDVVPIDLAGIYETGPPGVNSRAQDVLARYTEAKNERKYGLTTVESQGIREAIKTAGSVRKDILGIESAESYGDLIPLAKQTLKNLYSGVSDEIDELAFNKLNKITEAFQSEDIEEEMAIEAGKVLGDELAGIIETAKYDFNATTEQHHTEEGCFSSIRIDSPYMDDKNKRHLELFGERGTGSLIVNVYNEAYETRHRIIKQQHDGVISSSS